MVDQPLLPQRKPVAHLPQYLRLGDPDVVQVDHVLLRFGRHGPHVNRLKRHPRRRIVNDKHGDAAALSLLRIRHRLD